MDGILYKLPERGIGWKNVHKAVQIAGATENGFTSEQDKVVTDVLPEALKHFKQFRQRRRCSLMSAYLTGHTGGRE